VTDPSPPTEPPASPPPMIGVCAPMERARWAVWDQPATVVAANYLEAVWRAGGLTLVIPPDPRLVNDPDAILDRIDGLMLIGGSDVDAALYGQKSHPEAEAPMRDRDAVEIALTRGAIARRMPVLGICRGIQVINVAAGGTLWQHLPDLLGTTNHRRTKGTFVGNEHRVDLVEGSLAARSIGETSHRVFSHHHQSVRDVGAGLVVTGRAPTDETIEALEAEGGDGYLLAVQWHPEADPKSPVIPSLVEASRRV
jgi:putative glutamine amidotransferase